MASITNAELKMLSSSLLMKFLLLIACLVFSTYSRAQKAYDKNLRVNDAEFIVSGILFGGGTLSVAIGFLAKTGNAFLQATVGDQSENSAGNTFLIAGGISMIVGTILYFDARAKQKKRFALSISSVIVQKYNDGKLYSSNIPALSITIPLR
jgi:hypothetical protein